MDMKRATKAEHRTAQGKPILGIRYWIVAGKTRLPKPVPVADMARAKDRFLLKYELTTDRGGINIVFGADVRWFFRK